MLYAKHCVLMKDPVLPNWDDVDRNYLHTGSCSVYITFRYNHSLKSFKEAKHNGKEKQNGRHDQNTSEKELPWRSIRRQHILLL